MLKRAYSVHDILVRKNKVLSFSGKWRDSLGEPEVSGTIFIHGNSGQGKSTFVMQLIKVLCYYGKVLYNSLEESIGESFKQLLIRSDLKEVANKVFFLDRENMEGLKTRLRKKKAPKFVVIDSIQYFGISYKQYKELTDEFRDVLFIVISHANGRVPDGKVAQKIRYDSAAKIRIEGYAAFIISRWGGGAPYIIWEEKAKEYHGDDFINQNQNKYA